MLGQGTQIASLFATIGVDASKLNSGLTDAKTKLTGFKGTVSGVIQNLGGFDAILKTAGVGVGAVAAYVAVANQKFIDYNSTVGDLSTNLGLTTEETSRLVQMAGGFDIKMATTTATLQDAVKRGFQPSIENLANLADEYKAIQDPTERAALLFEKFGAGWKTWGPVMDAGGDTIRNNTQAVKDGLIVTADSIKKAQEFKDRQKEVNGALEDFGYTVAQIAIPPLTNLNAGLGASIDLINALINFGKEKIKGHIEEAAASHGLAIAMTDEEIAAHNLVATHGELAAALGLVDGEMVEVTSAMQVYSTQLLFAKAAQSMTSDAAMLLAHSMGLVDERTVYATERLATLAGYFDTNRDGMIDASEAANGYTDAVTRLNEQLLNMPKNIDVNINVRTNGSVGSELPGVGRRAAGGPVFPGGMYLVGESGPELLRMGRGGGGEVTPITNNNFSPSFGPITVNTGPNSDGRTMARELWRELNELMRKQSAAGYKFSGG